MRFVIILILFIGVQTQAQVFNPKRFKTINLPIDTIHLDTLSIVPSSVVIYDSTQNLIQADNYRIDYGKAEICFVKHINSSVIYVSYEVFPYNFSKPYFHKNKNLLATNKVVKINNFYFSNSAGDDGPKVNSLNKNGSISRGISIGNNQNAVVNSSLNLQLSGKLNNEVDILASISDNNIPIQPDGNTQKLQEFDKVFIQLSNEKTIIKVGDVETSNGEGFFLKYFKKVQGGYFSNVFLNHQFKVKNEITTAVSKGQFARKQFNGIEGVQGPYRLTGANNENYIIIIAGTERVYIDGILLKRGLDNDYTINYNTGELSFTPNQIITKDKRIIVEYEYSDKNYARFILTNNNLIETDKTKWWINIYSESDAKNQPLDQELTQEEKFVLASIGDSLQNALVYNIDSIEFTNDIVLYELTDTLTTAGIYYDSVFVYSTNPEKAFYRLGFAYVGEGNGNYIQDVNAVNGRVYKWIEPENGKRSGNYEPVVLLISPKKKQMINLGGSFTIDKTTTAFIEMGVSNYDLNTFSKYNDNDNVGVAFHSTVQKEYKFLNKSLVLNANYEFVNDKFNPVERYRPAEFERDWNIASDGKLNEHIVQLKAKMNGDNLKSSGIQSGYFIRGNDYKAVNNNFYANWSNQKSTIDINASYLTSEDIAFKTGFLRQKSKVSRKFGKLLIGAGEEQEINKWNLNDNDSLGGNSYGYFQYEIFAKSPDSSSLGFLTEYKNRNDYLPINNSFKNVSKSKDISLGLTDIRSANSQLKILSTYRSLSVLGTSLTLIKPEDNLLGRIDYRFKLWKGVITSSTFYEIGTGLELKKEFSYVEVSPGQGVYTWSDYNNNGVRELDEFEVAAFQDQANFIRVFLPTNEYVKTYSSQINQTFGIFPYKKWRNEKGIKKFAARFSDQMAIRYERKISEQDYAKILNVFNAEINDSILMNYTGSFRNTLSFNKISAKFGIDQTIQSNTSKLLLVNGFDTRDVKKYGIRFRWNISSMLTFNNYNQIGSKKYISEFFPTKNYELNLIEEEVKLSYQPNIKYRIILISKLKQKENNLGIEKSNVFEIGLETNYSIISKGILTAKASFLNVDYNAPSNSSIAYEMLEGFVAGKNYTWSIIGQFNISNSLQLDMAYNARANNDSKIIHNGTIQLRAYF